jgi:dienelactone hydrolase
MVQQRVSSLARSQRSRSILWLIAIACLGASACPASVADQFTSQGKKYEIEPFPPPAGGGKAKVVMIVHGSFGLAPPFLAQFRDLAEKLAAQGYLVFLPSYFFGGNLSEATLAPNTHLKTLTDALDYATKQPGADDQHVALIGFSLGGGLSLALAESAPSGRIKAVVDFYGPTTPDILNQVGKLPPSLILHNRTDGIVPISNSQNLDAALGKSLISHRFKVYDEHNPDPMFKDHPFAPGGPADKDSQEQIVKWLAEHLKWHRLSVR